MTVRIRIIDERNQLYGFMRYQAICSLPQFFEIREWCWTNYGPGVEYEHYKNCLRVTDKKYKWVWDCAKYQGASISSGKIYLPDDNEMLAGFTLTWG